jgi:hypothetical protein
MSSDNPYQAPKTTSPPAPKRAPGRLMFGILLLIGMVPASAIAFFCCCLAGVAAAERPGQPGPDQTFTVGMLAGAVGGLVVFVLMLWGGIRMIRRSA